MSGTLYKGAKITFVTEQVEQKTLYKPRVENYAALIAQDINANWGRTTSAEIKEDAINRNDAHAKSAVFYFHKHSYQLWGSQGAGLPRYRKYRDLFRFLFGCPKRKD